MYNNYSLKLNKAREVQFLTETARAKSFQLNNPSRLCLSEVAIKIAPLHTSNSGPQSQSHPAGEWLTLIATCDNIVFAVSASEKQTATRKGTLSPTAYSAGFAWAVYFRYLCSDLA